MKQILFPTDHDSSSTHVGPKWTAMNPMLFAQSMAQLAGPQPLPNLSERRGQLSLRIDTSFLAEESPSIPHIPRNAVGIVPHHIISKVDNDVIMRSPDNIRSGVLLLNKKRAKNPTSPTLVPFDEDDGITLPSFHPSFLLAHNPKEPTAKLAVSEFLFLAQTFESMPKYNECLSSYKRFRDGLLQMSQMIHGNNDTMADKSFAFTQMYSTFIQQIKALITLAQKLQDEEQSEQASRTLKPERTGSVDSDDSDAIHPIFRRVYNKKGFTAYMNQWLVQNWTNPYPDDEGLADLAELNGTTHTIVSNWLINARTRKWRPAIVKAFEMGRPADMLKEDSINVFERKRLRKL